MINQPAKKRARVFLRKLEQLSFALQDIEEAIGHDISKVQDDLFNDINDKINTMENLIRRDLINE